MSEFRRRLMFASSRLPYDAEVEWLDNNRWAFINTGIIPKLTYKFSCRFYVSTDPDNLPSNGCLFGCFSAWNSHCFCFSNNAVSGAGYNMWGNRNTNYSNKATLDTWHTLEFKNKRTYIDGNSSSASPGTGEPEYTMHVFAMNFANRLDGEAAHGSYGLGAPKKIAWAKLQDANDNLLFDYIPVRVGNVGYMYDKVTGRLFGDANTIETIGFSVGQDV